MLARPGRPVTVSLDLTPRASAVTSAALAVTTNSRGCPREQVFALVSESLRALQGAGATLLYKKLDSNLRGHLGAELAAVLTVTGGPILFAPAFPARGRTTVDGTVRVNGTPVAETEMGRDPQSPVTHSRVADLLRYQEPLLVVAECPLAEVRRGPEAILARLAPGSVLVADAETDADLDLLAEAALTADVAPALAGSAGFADALGRRLLGPRSRTAWPKETRGPVFGLLASSSPNLQTQAAQAAQVGLTVVPFPSEKLSRRDEPVPEVDATLAQAGPVLAAGRDVLICATGDLPDVEHPVELVVEHLAHLAFVLIKGAHPQALLVGGGSTAQAVLGALGAQALAIDDEPLSGIAAGLTVGGDFAGHPIVLKPGAAGGPEAVAELIHYLGRRVQED